LDENTTSFESGEIVSKVARTAHREERERVQKYTKVHDRRRRIIIWSGGPLALASIILVVIIASGSSGIRGLHTFTEAIHTHVSAASIAYDRNPPAGGAHSANWQNCGVYDQPIANVNGVHSLEHGAVWITYREGLGFQRIDQLRNIAVSHYDGAERYIVLTPYPGLSAPIVVSAWGAQLTLQSSGDPRIEQFLSRYVGGGQGGEKGASCTGGPGTPIQ
jgi:hypothetical protein